MAIKKFALCEIEEIIEVDSKLGIIRTASSKIMIEPDSEKSKIIAAEVKKHPDALFFRAKAIVGDETNSNGDYFSSEELVKSHKSFEGVPFFTNHDNQNIENAKGKIIFAEWVPEEKAVYTIAFVDRGAYPDICRGIEEEYMSGVSMGTSVEYSVCSICKNTAERVEDYCGHIRNRKGRKFTGTSKDVTTGETKHFKDADVFEFNYGLKFIELSAVVDPACPTCHIEGVIPNQDFIKRVANMQNELYMIKTSALEKEASQEDIDQLNQCLQVLEDILVNLIRNREQVEMEFASDLADILANLQTFTEELIGGGFGNIPGTAEGTSEGTAEGVPEEGQVPLEAAPGTMPPQTTPQAVPQATPVGEQQPLGVGDISGLGSPTPTMPQMPITSPMRPAATIFDVNKIHRISDLVVASAGVRDKIYKVTGIKSGEDDMAKRRTLSARNHQKQKAMEILENSWKEKASFFEYIKQVPSLQNNDTKLSVKKRDDSFIIVAENKGENPTEKIWTFEELSDDEKGLIVNSPHDAALHFLNNFAENLNIKQEGVTGMTDKIKEAGADSVNKAPEVVQEAQLEEQRNLYHARTDAEDHEISEKQLDRDNKYPRKGEKDYITEKQLDDPELKLNPRENDEPEVITQKQLDDDSSGVSVRTDEDKHVVTQKQLDENRVNNEPEVITEKQLDDIAAPWERAASRDSAMFKSAGEHMEAVVNVLADSAIATGATPEEISDVAGDLVDSTQDRYELLMSLLDEEEIEKEAIDYSKRLAFWGSKNVKVAGVSKSDISNLVVSGLKFVVADTTINPEIIADALDVAAEDEAGITSITKAIDSKLEAAKKNPVTKVSVKDELRQALKKTDDSKEERDSKREKILASVAQKEVRKAERGIWAQSLKEGKNGTTPDTVIETSFSELGSQKQDPNFRQALKSFAKGALASRNEKIAAITNVTISGETIQIAVQTDEGGESVEIPIGNDVPDAPVEDGALPEGDLTGEGLENSLDVPPVQEMDAMPGYMGGFASTKNKMQRTAQFGGGGGGVPGTPGGVTAPGAPEQGLPGPTDGNPIQNLTQDDGGIDDDIPTAGEQQVPWAICPECGSSNVDVEDTDGDIHGDCQACGAGYEALVKKAIEFTIRKPGNIGGEGAEAPSDMPEAPEVPALPVAAETNLDKKGLVRMASNQEKHGHVCPSCGMSHCKASVEEDGHIEYECPACATEVTKDILVNNKNPENSKLRVAWDFSPPASKCKDCEDKSLAFASNLKVNQMIRQAQYGEEGSTPFPMANCLERIARKWGTNATASNGPCKGKPLAECVCGQLQTLGLRTVRHMERLGSVYSQEDAMEECVKDQMDKHGFNVKEASTICGCIKKKIATKDSENPFMEAFAKDIEEGREKILTAQDLRTIHDVLGNGLEEADEQYEDEDIGSDLSPIETTDVIEKSQDEGTINDEIINVEITRDSAEEISSATEEALRETEPETEIQDEIHEVAIEVPELESATEFEVSERVPEINEEEKEMALSMQTHKLRRVGDNVVNVDAEVLKTAGKPKQVKDIEGDVEAGVPRAKATIRNEGPDNIDVPMATPSVPRANATMGHEGPDNINKPAGLPDVAVDSAYMGDESNVQKGYDHANSGRGMPEINNEIKGTVIAETDDIIVVAEDDTVQKKAKKLKEVETVEGDVEAGVPRADATIRNESKDNIDVPMATPSVPRAKATMGHEGPDNIDVSADAPDVPVDNAYMGHEKDVQKSYDHANSGKGMPDINDEYLKQVQQKREKQLDRISKARQIESIKVASKLLAQGRIEEEAYDNVQIALANFEIHKIAEVAASMYPAKKQTKVASTGENGLAGHAIPGIVLESKDPEREDNYTTRLSSSFTIGDHALNNNLLEEGKR